MDDLPRSQRTATTAQPQAAGHPGNRHGRWKRWHTLEQRSVRVVNNVRLEWVHIIIL